MNITKPISLEDLYNQTPKDSYTPLIEGDIITNDSGEYCIIWCHDGEYRLQNTATRRISGWRVNAKEPAPLTEHIAKLFLGKALNLWKRANIPINEIYGDFTMKNLLQPGMMLMSPDGNQHLVIQNPGKSLRILSLSNYTHYRGNGSLGDNSPLAIIGTNWGKWQLVPSVMPQVTKLRFSAPASNPPTGVDLIRMLCKMSAESLSLPVQLCIKEPYYDDAAIHYDFVDEIVVMREGPDDKEHLVLRGESAK